MKKEYFLNIYRFNNFDKPGELIADLNELLKEEKVYAEKGHIRLKTVIIDYDD